MNTTEHPTYKLDNVPPREDSDWSRFALPVTEEGWSLPGGRAAVIAHSYGELLQDRKRETPPNTPTPTTVDLRWPVLEGGTWKTVYRGSVSRVPVFENRRPGRYAKTSLSGGQLLDALFLGDQAVWSRVRDDACWDALAEFCAQENPGPRELRAIADAVAVVLCLRAGLDVEAEFDLPHPASLRQGVT